MQSKSFPELPKDLQHPGHLVGKGEDQPAPAQASIPPAGDTLKEEPIFDDPVIGWWENAWLVRDTAGNEEEPLI